MFDLNELKVAADSGKIDKEAVQVVIRDGKVVDFLTVDDVPRPTEEVRTMPLVEMLIEVFWQK
jgi:hypothetical protein